MTARNILAREFHPDLGGNDRHMALVNEAYEYIIEKRRRILSNLPISADSASAGFAQSCATIYKRHEHLASDFPSFTVNALPVVAFEVLLLAAQIIGNVVTNDPPYVLEVLIEDPPMTMCHLEIMPDAGSSTVGFVIDSFESSNVDVTAVRDLWVTTINEIGRSSREMPCADGL